MDILKRIEKFESEQLPRLKKLYKYYLNENTPQELFKEEGKPANKIKSNFCKSIVSNTTGYYMTNPITYITEDTELAREIEAITAYNDDDTVNMTLAEDRSIFGSSYELHYIDYYKKNRYYPLSPLQTIPIFDNGLEAKMTACIYFYDVFDEELEETQRYVNFYNAYEAVEYMVINGTLAELNRTQHFFNDVPVVQILNNRHARGDFEDILSLQDAYNILQSESLNDFQTFADAYLYISGMTIDENEAKKIRENKIINGDGNAEWLVKSTNDTHIQNLKNNVKEDIFATSLTANFSDESFGNNLSGQALRYKIMNMENRVGETQKFVEKGLSQRWKLICNYLNVLGNYYDYKTIKYKFIRNLPQNLAEIATITSQLSGTVSQKTLLSQIPFIDNVERELQQIQEEAGEYTNFEEIEDGE